MNKEAHVLLGIFQGRDLDLATRALYFAEEAHRGQKRNNGDDYFSHPLRAARMGHCLMRDKSIIGELRPGHPAGISHADLDVFLAFLLLHDVDEDTSRTSIEIGSQFGPRVERMVRQVTKKKTIPIQEYFGGMEDGTPDEVLVILGKAIDRVCNVDDMVETFSPERLEKYINETETYVLTLMKRARKRYIHYAHLLIVCRDYIKGVLRGARVRLEKDRQVADMKGLIATADAAISRMEAKIAELEGAGSRQTGIQSGD